MKEESLYLAGRVAIFVVFFWFGILKLFGVSPADPIVTHLLSQTMPFWPENQFILILGAEEMLIGMLFLFHKTSRIALILLGLHMATTFLPLILLPSLVWQAPFVPTLEGQYILKNFVIIALALFVGFHTHVGHAHQK